MSSSKPSPEEYPSSLERFLGKFNNGYYWVPLAYLAGYVILSVVLLFTIAPLIDPFGGIIDWIIPGAISFPLMLYFIKRVRRRSAYFLEQLKERLPSRDFRAIDVQFKKLYSRWYLLPTAAIVAVLVLFQVYSFVLNPPAWLAQLYQSDYPLALAHALVNIISTGVWSFFLGVLLSFVVGNVVCGVVPLRDKGLKMYAKIKDGFGGLSFLSAHVNDVLKAWFIPTLIWMYTYTFRVTAWWAVSVFIVYLSISILVLLAAVYYSHKTLTRSRGELLNEVTGLEEKLDDVLQSKSRARGKGSLKSIDDTLEGILICMAGQSKQGAIESIQTYPFDAKGIGSITLAVVPLVLQVVQTVLSLAGL